MDKGETRRSRARVTATPSVSDMTPFCSTPDIADCRSRYSEHCRQFALLQRAGSNEPHVVSGQKRPAITFSTAGRGHHSATRESVPNVVPLGATTQMQRLDAYLPVATMKNRESLGYRADEELVANAMCVNTAGLPVWQSGATPVPAPFGRRLFWHPPVKSLKSVEAVRLAHHGNATGLTGGSL